eukprot:262195_1
MDGVMLNQTLINRNNPANRKKSRHEFWYLNWKAWISIIFVVIVLVLFIVTIIFIYNKSIEYYLSLFLHFVEHNLSLGILSCVGLYWACTVCMVPGSIFGLSAGFVFGRALTGQWVGIAVATIIVWIGASIGSITAYGLARCLLRDRVASCIFKHKNIDIVDQIIEENGLKVTLLLRLSPIIPFNIMNYLMGVSSVTFKAYCLATIVGILPGALTYCFVGSTLSELSDALQFGNSFGNTKLLILAVVGSVIALIGIIYIGRVARKEFNKLATELLANQDSFELELSTVSDNEPSTSVPTEYRYLLQDPQF